MAQLVEHILGKDEVPSSNLGSSSKKTRNPFGLLVFFVFGATTIGLELALRAPFGAKQNPVRIRLPKIEELALQAQGARIFALGEYLG